MQAEFWQRCWQNNTINFHKTDVNPLLIEFLPQLHLAQNSRIFLPLCGKTRDIAWLLQQGYQVIGAELSALAVEQLFTELGLSAQTQVHNGLTLHCAKNLQIWQGDIFALQACDIGAVDAIYDRAALVALPNAMRKSYTAHLRTLSNTAKQLLISFEYAQELMAGPPFSISEAEMQAHYAEHYQITQLYSENLAEPMGGMSWQKENVWLLNTKR